MQRLRFNNVNIAAEQILQVLHQGDMVEQASARLESDEQVQIAPRLVLVAAYRPKNSQLCRAVSRSDLEYDIASGLHELVRAHGLAPLLGRLLGPFPV